MASSSDIEPLYLKHSDLPSKDLKAYDICCAMSNKIGTGKVEGAQRIKNVWSLYLKDQRARVDLFTKQTIVIRGRVIQIYDKNPATHQQSMHKPSDKITVKDIPLNVPNEDIKTKLESIGVIFITQLKDSYERDADGNISHFKNGDRFAYIESMESPIPRNLTINTYTAVIIHHGRDNRPCKSCNESGHKFVDMKCPAKPTVPIYAFKPFEHPLSNY